MNKKSGRLMSKFQRRILIYTFVLALAVIIAVDRSGWLRSSGGPSVDKTAVVSSDRERYDEKWFQVARVVDGDTLDLAVADLSKGTPTTRVRLQGVDTPETHHPKYGKMYFGPEATAFTEKLTLNKEVRVVMDPFHETRGKYGRLLVYIFVSKEEMLNEMLISEGYGYADPRFDHVLMERFLRLGKQARADKKGLWKGVKPEDMPAWMRN